MLDALTALVVWQCQQSRFRAVEFEVLHRGSQRYVGSVGLWRRSNDGGGNVTDVAF